jgi:hypothetical protein
MSTLLHKKISIFLKKRHDIFKKPLEKIINSMLDQCKYINGESLERHNWGDKPLKLKYTPTDINSPTFEDDLIKALDTNDLENIDKSNIELLWGDIQLGKRVQACIIMWFSVHILKRPVLYIFRNLSIDQKQLQDDITGTEKYNFNTKFIKELFKEFNKELQDYYGEPDMDYSDDYRLPNLKDISSDDIINKLSNKGAINSNDIFCCLMNYKQLDKINKKFSEYISYNNELVDISILVDESDLSSPTASNDRSNDNDMRDSTLCEALVAKIYKKVKYALHITGTAHSLLYNTTTRLSDQLNIQIKISKVHKMKRMDEKDEYYGLFNNRINFNTEVVNSWWDTPDIENNKKICYDIIEDYNVNIKKIIEIIVKRSTKKYNSLLISEEKIRDNQFKLINKIITDFPNLFIVIYHGNCLRLYLSKDYEQEIKRLSQWDAKNSTANQRLFQTGGVYGSSEDFIDILKTEKLPNNYCYFTINTKILNIKLVYKLLRILFEKSETKIKNKTVITITGKYGERGYSFTSDNYDDFSFHLTDQYFVSHATFNCTDISQRLRLQGKYNDIELKNGTMKLTLWTTEKLQDIIENFYVKFIKEIEKYIMDCKNWEEIKDLFENKILDNGELKFGKYMRYIDVSKKRKNLKTYKCFDKKYNGYSLITIDDMTDEQITEWCKEKKLPVYNCINTINNIIMTDFIEKYGKTNIKTVPYIMNEDLSIPFVNECIEKTKIEYNIEMRPIRVDWFETREKKINNYYCETIGGEKIKIKLNEFENNLIRYKTDINHNTAIDGTRRIYIAYDDNDKANICVSFRDNNKKLPKKTNDYINKTPYNISNDIVKYSILKDEYKKCLNKDDVVLPDNYYWKTPDGWLYLYDKNKRDIYTLHILSTQEELTIKKKKKILNKAKNDVINNKKNQTINDDLLQIKKKKKIINKAKNDLIDNTTNEVINNITNEVINNTTNEVINNTTNEIINNTKNDVINNTKNDVINDDLLLFTNTCFKKTDNLRLRIGVFEIYDIFKTWCLQNNKKCSILKNKFKEELEKLNYFEHSTKGIDIHDKFGKRGFNITVSI